MGCLKLLVRHFFGRFFDNEIVSQSGDMRTNVVQAFGLVATPGIFVPFYMIPQRARFDHPFAYNWVLLSDYYFFIMFSMVVMGFVMVFEWDALFPDRKDYLILTPLPLGGGSDLRRQDDRPGGVPGPVHAGCEPVLYAAGAAGYRGRGHACADRLEADAVHAASVVGGRRLRGPEYRERAGRADQSVDRARIPPGFAVGADGADERPDRGSVSDAAGLRRHSAAGGEP